MMFPNYPDVVTVPQMQKMLRISKPTAYNLINDGYIKCVKMGGTYRISKICIINYVLEDIDTHVCPQIISRSLLCQYFRFAVLPYDKALYSEICLGEVKRCAVCGELFKPKSNRQKHCDKCSLTLRKKQKALSERNRRKRDD